ncbi:hypothetical protein J437_LFUL002594 [Ladona fulva]|uniref:Cyclic nucleotide-binding domain-containing protein n=1 Tax=Ladona fulva TaxID=123851 RepID=A0A8K0JTX2_LADFU|nr:hypothetical protein J437_LFUL002594 [Ladona fulva]
MIFPEPMEIIAGRISEKNINKDMEKESCMKYETTQVEGSRSQPPNSHCKCSAEQNGGPLATAELNMRIACESERHDNFIHAQMTHLAGAFSARAQLFLSKLQRPPTPTQSSTSSFNSSSGINVQSNVKLKKTKGRDSFEKSANPYCMVCVRVLDPQSRAYLWWLVTVSLCFAYNLWAIPLRTSFPKHTLTIWDSSFKSDWKSSTGHSVISPKTNTISYSQINNRNYKEDSNSNHFIKNVENVRSTTGLFTNSSNESKGFLDHTSTDSSKQISEIFAKDRENHSKSLSPSPISVSELDVTKSGIFTTPSNHLSNQSVPNSSKSNYLNLLTPGWLSLDIFCDIIYLLDILVVQPRVSFISESGIWVKEMSTTLKKYTKRKKSKLDIFALLPLDLIFYFVSGGKDFAFLRIPRLFKAGTFWEMCERLDVTLASPHAVRIARTVASMLYLVHLHACAYYLFSKWEGIASNGWVFSGRGNAYVRCFYFATKTATSIGKNPKPVNEAEYVFMTWSWLSGVFVFALLIGQIRDIVATASKSKSEFQRLLDETIHYMRRIHLPTDTQRRVMQWLTHTWDHQQVLDEQEVLEWLPSKLRGDVALDVHECSLSKVHLFRHCGQQLLRQLVLKLRPVLYLPGDYICRKGEVGKEMYIIKAGIVEVVGSKKTGSDGLGGYEVLATLTEGSVFGEISLLDIGGGNRRTADVSQLMRENADREQKIERESQREEDAVIIKQDSAVGTKSKAAQLLMYGSKALYTEKDKLVTNTETFGTEGESAIKLIVEDHSDAGNCLSKSETLALAEECVVLREDESFVNPSRDPSLAIEAEYAPSPAFESEPIVSVSNGMHKQRMKSFGSKNVFECDVTVHHRIG